VLCFFHPAEGSRRYVLTTRWIPTHVIRGSGAGPTGRVHVRLRINDVNGVNDSS